MTNQTSVADTAATQILAHEILYDIGVPASREMVSRISARLEEAVESRARANEATYIADAIRIGA
jgi:hypothetical protein